MNSKRFSSVLSLMVIIGMLLFGVKGETAQAQSTVPGDLATVTLTSNTITWTPLQKTARLYLTVSATDGRVFTQVFENGTPAVLGLKNTSGQILTDGMYRYELVAMPVLDAETLALLAKTTQENREEVMAKLRDKGKISSQPMTQSGVFSVDKGAFLMAAVEEAILPGTQGVEPSGIITPQDQVVADDMIVTGSLCVGFDCVNGESFGFDTVRLKENNLRVYFDDTSATAGFPAIDWQLIANDSASGGASYFAIQDASAGRNVFSVAAGAPANALFVSSVGKVGIKTSTPVLDLHINGSDTPAIRLEQNGSSGWTPQTWDVAGNEANFFIRDITNGSKLPFRIFPGAPTNSLTIKSDGKVGIGTNSPTEQLHVAGNVRVDGYVVEFSDANVKMGFLPANGTEILKRLLKMPVSSWSYIAEGGQVRHMGPTAQDFYAAFGLGADNKHIAALDTNGVALAAIQELARLSAAQDIRITALENQNEDLENRVADLEKLVQALIENSK